MEEEGVTVMDRVAIALILVALLAGCVKSDGPATSSQPGNGSQNSDPACHLPATEPQDGFITLQLYFTCESGELDEPKPVLRQVPQQDDTLTAAIEHLLAGPAENERAVGFRSFFSADTASMVNSVLLNPDGRVVVDFKDFRQRMVNASTTAGARQLMTELGKTIAQFPQVTEMEYRFNGSCEAFWHWLQADCQIQAAAQYR